MIVRLISEIKDSCGYQVTRIYCVENEGSLHYIQEDQSGSKESTIKSFRELQLKDIRLRDDLIIKISGAIQS
jgi:hypothetical protein